MKISDLIVDEVYKLRRVNINPSAIFLDPISIADLKSESRISFYVGYSISGNIEFMGIKVYETLTKDRLVKVA